jgi:hypothetical protein
LFGGKLQAFSSTLDSGRKTCAFANDNNDVVRAVMYVNSGNSRVDLNSDIMKRWKDESGNPSGCAADRIYSGR